MTPIRELYQDVILEHNRAPHNYRDLVDANRRAEGYNPLCGDRITVSLKVEGDRIEDIAFQGSGCAISKASASLMTMAVKGKTLADAERYFEAFRNMVKGERQAGPSDLPVRLNVLSGVAEFPIRIKCATLPWHALKAAIEEGINRDASDD
jgi:nitrogen fixation NifU-like protein